MIAESYGKSGLPRWHSGKESTFQCRREGFDPWVRKVPWSRKFSRIPEKFHGQRSLVVCSPWGHKALAMTE